MWLNMTSDRNCINGTSILQAFVWNIICGEELAHLEQFRGWLAEHKQRVAGLDPAEVYSNWLENANFVEEHNLLASRGFFNYKLTLNAFAHKVTGLQLVCNTSLTHQLPKLTSNVLIFRNWPFQTSYCTGFQRPMLRTLRSRISRALWTGEPKALSIQSWTRDNQMTPELLLSFMPSMPSGQSNMVSW